MLYIKAMPNSINFYKGILLHFIPVRIIVPCSDFTKKIREKQCSAQYL